jgi:O-antigen/teichoic acid export membrane protein
MSATAADTQHRGQLEKLARRGTASVAGAACSAVFGTLLIIIVTNGFSPSVAGTLFAATSAFLILESVVLLGTDTGLVRWLPAHLASGRSSDVPRALLSAAVPVLALSVLGSVVLHVTAASLAPSMVGSDDAASATMVTILQALALALPVAALHNLVLAATRGMGSMRPTVIVENIGRLGVQSLAVLAVFLAGGGALSLALAWSLPYALGLLWGGWWLRGQVAMAGRPQGLPAPWRDVAGEFWSYTAPRALARITQTALKRSDIVLVAALASPADAALYTAATRFVVLGQLIVQSVQQALSPHLSTLFAKGETGAANSIFQAATAWSMLAAWPIYLVTAGFAVPLMIVFGDGYSVASDVLVILSLTMLLATVCGPVDSVLLMAGHSWLSLANSTIALTVNIGLNVVLIPLDGIRGAAIAWSVAIVVRNVLPLLQVRRHLDMWPITRPSMLAATTSIACFGTVDVVLVLAEPALGVALVLLAVGLTAYVLGIWSQRVPLGLDAFRSALRRRGTAAVLVPAGGGSPRDTPA